MSGEEFGSVGVEQGELEVAETLHQAGQVGEAWGLAVDDQVDDAEETLGDQQGVLPTQPGL